VGVAPVLCKEIPRPPDDDEVCGGTSWTEQTGRLRRSGEGTKAAYRVTQRPERRQGAGKGVVSG